MYARTKWQCVILWPSPAQDLRSRHILVPWRRDLLSLYGLLDLLYGLWGMNESLGKFLPVVGDADQEGSSDFLGHTHHGEVILLVLLLVDEPPKHHLLCPDKEPEPDLRGFLLRYARCP